MIPCGFRASTANGKLEQHDQAKDDYTMQIMFLKYMKKVEAVSQHKYTLHGRRGWGFEPQTPPASAEALATWHTAVINENDSLSIVARTLWSFVNNFTLYLNLSWKIYSAYHLCLKVFFLPRNVILASFSYACAHSIASQACDFH